MPSIQDAADEAASILKARIKDIETELSRLQRALAQLTDGREGRRGPGRPRGTARTTASRGTAGRRRGRRRGTRADQAVKLIKDNPGIGASDIARRMRIKPNYLYRVLGDLQKEGRVKKEGRSYTAV
jgi:sugar-specific transcriptional regulator TrmB